jgi:hypothetical protein
MEKIRIRNGKNSDPGWKKFGSGSRNKYPGSATLVITVIFLVAKGGPVDDVVSMAVVDAGDDLLEEAPGLLLLQLPVLSRCNRRARRPTRTPSP